MKWVLYLQKKIPWRRQWQPTPVLLPGKSHGQRSLVGYSPWGRKESDTTERLYLLTYMRLRFGRAADEFRGRRDLLATMGLKHVVLQGQKWLNHWP